MGVVGRLLLAVLLCASALALGPGCATTNIDDRPTWAKAPRLQPESPLFPQYPAARYLSTVATDTQPALSGAIDGAKGKAIDYFTEQLSGQAIALAASGARGRSAQAYADKVREVVARGRGDVALCVENVLGWDGFDRESKVYFGCYVFDKERAGNLVAQRASASLDQVETIGKRLQDPTVTQGETERLAIEMLQSLLDLSVAKQQCIFLGKEVAWIDGFGKTELACAERVYEAGRRREATGTEDDLFEAKKFYDEAAKLRQDPLIDAAIDRVGARLPCDRCKPLLGEVTSKTAEIEELRRRMGMLGDAPEAERMALEGVKAIDDRRRALEHPHAFFKERLPALEDMTPFEQVCVQRVYAAGERLERLGTERDLEQALKFYEDSVRIRNDSVLAGRILEVKRRLPCTECGRAAKCVICLGAKGKDVTCGTCNGSRQVPTTCPVCRGDGHDVCSRCSGRQTIVVQCRQCDRGRITCGVCAGRGTTENPCNTCGGVGSQNCPNYVPNHANCYSCRGTMRVACSQCRGAGRFTNPCAWCGRTGKVACATCGGTAQVNATCDQCNGSGRWGICKRCNGDRQVLIQCTRCRNGYVWQDCARCKGAGVCPTCEGKAHRQ